MSKPTFESARNAILDAYEGKLSGVNLDAIRGVRVKRALKVPQVVLPSGDVLYFRPQAVYLNAHSTWLDIRTMTPQTFVHEIQARINEKGR